MFTRFSNVESKYVSNLCTLSFFFFFFWFSGGETFRLRLGESQYLSSQSHTVSWWKMISSLPTLKPPQSFLFRHRHGISVAPLTLLASMILLTVQTVTFLASVNNEIFQTKSIKIFGLEKERETRKQSIFFKKKITIGVLVDAELSRAPEVLLLDESIVGLTLSSSPSRNKA